MDLKIAYQLLGVNKDTSKDEIRRKYYVLSKRYEAQKRDPDTKPEDIVDIAKIIEAYNSLMDYDKLDPEEEAILRRPPNPIYKKLGIDEKKANTFFYYYKNKLIIGIIVLVTLFSMIRGCIMQIDPDLYISLIGNLYISEEEAKKVTNKITAAFPEIKETTIDNMFISSGNSTEQDIAIQQKAMLVLTVGDTDIVIMDRMYYETYAVQGAFLNLDEYKDSWEIDLEKNNDNILKLEETNEKHLFGIDISESTFFKDIELLGKEKIAAIKFNAKNKEEAVKVLELIVKQK